MSNIHIDNKEATKILKESIIDILKAIKKYNTSDIVAIKALDTLEDSYATSITVQNCNFTNEAKGVEC